MATPFSNFTDTTLSEMDSFLGVISRKAAVLQCYCAFSGTWPIQESLWALSIHLCRENVWLVAQLLLLVLTVS